jgi:hypothetical protein
MRCERRTNTQSSGENRRQGLRVGDLAFALHYCDLAAYSTYHTWYPAALGPTKAIISVTGRFVKADNQAPCGPFGLVHRGLTDYLLARAPIGCAPVRDMAVKPICPRTFFFPIGATAAGLAFPLTGGAEVYVGSSFAHPALKHAKHPIAVNNTSEPSTC